LAQIDVLVPAKIQQNLVQIKFKSQLQPTPTLPVKQELQRRGVQAAAATHSEQQRYGHAAPAHDGA